MAGHINAFRRPKPEHGIEGLGLERATYLLKGPAALCWTDPAKGEPGGESNPYKCLALMAGSPGRFHSRWRLYHLVGH
jgi:hypothetical protein